MYYCFLEDQSFFPTRTIDLGNLTLPTVGYLGSNEEAYFYTKATVLDPRTTRLPYGSYDMSGLLKLHFDQSKTSLIDSNGNDVPDLFQSIIGEDPTAINTLSLERLFMLIDRIAFSNNETLIELDKALIEERAYSAYYKPESVALAKKYTEVVSYQEGAQVKVKVPDWISFTFMYESATQDPIYYDFKIWISRQAFLEEYPLSTIIKVILPCDYQTILNPSLMTSAVDSVIDAINYSFGSIDERYKFTDNELGIQYDDDKLNIKDISTTDTSGLATHKTTYMISSQATTKLPFGVLYKGHIPSTMEMRKAIREHLIGTYGLEDKWRQLLPDLFVTASFYIVPVFDNITASIDGVNIYPSIINYKSLKPIFIKLFPDVEASFIDKYQEVMLCGQSEIFLTTLPDYLNEYGNFSIYDIHPKYQYHTTQDPAYAYQPEATKDFNKKLNRCMAIIMGETVIDATVDSNYFDGKNYLSFTSNATEFHVLTKQSYVDTFMSE